jgi:hypothetical protein
VYQHALLDLSKITLRGVPDDIFKLPAYGLPELPLRAIRPTPTFSYHNPLIWFALATMVISFAVLWRTRQNAAKTSPSSAH